MDGRIDDDDGNLLGSFTASPPPRPNFHCYSEKSRVSPNHDDEQEHHNRNRKFSLDEDSGTTRTPKIFDRFYDSSSDDEFYSAGSANSETGLVKNAGKRLDYMIQFLDRKFSLSDETGTDNNRALPEFVADGGGKGIFKVPVRAAVHPGRPPSLELRPQPIRDTQIGCFLRTVVCTDDSQLWAGSECGVRLWNLSEMYSSERGMETKASQAPSGDEEAAPFHESVRTSSTLCLIADSGNRVVWSGHKDGSIRCWKMDQCFDGTPFKEALQWQAHRSPVLSIVMTSYGDLWSGSEGGIIKIWPWEATEKSLSLTLEERHMAGLLIERSYIDLRSQVTVNGNCCNIFAADVKYMFSDHSGSKVWSAGYLSFALW
ncbi:unnamed protein product [Ilex paraguariensis]|uniref:IP5PC-F beta-propeller domain-containing protein n=1 Tax=Ilex paraguariensis TaxID=185542 RepID=A0ABC8UL10_9AQUA